MFGDRAAGVEHRSVSGNLKPIGYAQLTSAATAQSLPDVATMVALGARLAMVQTLTKGLRWRDDGTSPTTSVGMQLAAGSVMLYDGDLESIEIIEESASAEVNISYYNG